MIQINEKIEKAKVAVTSKKAAETKAITPSRGKSGSSVSVPSAGNAQAILNEAYAQLGKPYVWGATGANSFDCSGFTQYVYRNAAGVDISRTTYTLVNIRN